MAPRRSAQRALQLEYASCGAQKNAPNSILTSKSGLGKSGTKGDKYARETLVLLIFCAGDNDT
jgi:hypothetical protein